MSDKKEGPAGGGFLTAFLTALLITVAVGIVGFGGILAYSSISYRNQIVEVQAQQQAAQENTPKLSGCSYSGPNGTYRPDDWPEPTARASSRIERKASEPNAQPFSQEIQEEAPAPAPDQDPEATAPEPVQEPSQPTQPATPSAPAAAPAAQPSAGTASAGDGQSSNSQSQSLEIVAQPQQTTQPENPGANNAQDTYSANFAAGKVMITKASNTAESRYITLNIVNQLKKSSRKM